MAARGNSLRQEEQGLRDLLDELFHGARITAGKYDEAGLLRVGGREDLGLLHGFGDAELRSHDR